MNAIPAIRLRRQGADLLDPLLEDETLSSWVARQRDRVDLAIESTSAWRREADYGPLEFEGDWHPDLKSQLRASAVPPDEWLLEPRDRVTGCPRCWAEDWANGRPLYLRRSWSISWRATCPMHGRLAISPPNWQRPYSCALPPVWEGREIGIFPQIQGRGCRFAFSIGDDRRAMHLEAAMGASQASEPAWFPRGHSTSSLREAYAVLSESLCRQFLLGQPSGCPNTRSLSILPTLPAEHRYAINVIAEAVLSDWTDSPLPESADPKRTSLIVRAIGWALPRPQDMRANRLSNCQCHLQPKYWAECFRAATKGLANPPAVEQPRSRDQVRFLASEELEIFPPGLAAWVEQRTCVGYRRRRTRAASFSTY